MNERIVDDRYLIHRFRSGGDFPARPPLKTGLMSDRRQPGFMWMNTLIDACIAQQLSYDFQSTSLIVIEIFVIPAIGNLQRHSLRIGSCGSIGSHG